MSFSEVNLRGADLRNADLSRVQMDRVDLSGADLSGSILEGAVLAAVTCEETRFCEANLNGAVLVALVGGRPSTASAAATIPGALR